MEFLTIGRWEVAGRTFEIAGRGKLDSRQVLPWFEEGGTLHAGVLERARPSRTLRGAPERGLEAIGFDFSRVDETGDIRDYGRAIFSERAQVEIEDGALPIALPSWARSIGYLTELTLPLLLRVRPPAARSLDVTWDGGQHRIEFVPIAALAERLGDGGTPAGEELQTLLGALAPAPRRRFDESPGAAARLSLSRVLDARGLARQLAEPADLGSFHRLADAEPDALRFLHVTRVGRFEVLTPGSGLSVALLPHFVHGGEPWFLLWTEIRPAALERGARQPLYDLPVPPRYVNATGFFVRPEELGDAQALSTRLLSRALGGPVEVVAAESLGPPAEPAVSVSSELRRILSCTIDPRTLPALPEDAFVISAPELAAAVGGGLIRDPVVVAGLVRLGLDPFAAARTGEPARRRAFVDLMTQGSVVQRRLRGYSSIEAEQLAAPTYARLMTLLQHEFGLRIVYPRTEKDRGFFKAAYRVFMAADRGEDRALQGLHFSHDCYHFALGNFAPPPPPDFARWYASGAPPPAEPAPSGPDWEAYSTALKHAENAATFFSFWTLYAEHLPLARHVGKLTFFEAMRDLGYHDHERVWPIYLDLVDRAVVPEAVAAKASARPDIAELLEYMRGFRDYHFKDIAIAWKFAVQSPYRGYTIRFGIYESDLGRYLAGVHAFPARLAAYPVGLNPLLAACADVKVDLALRVWDVMKALRLVREPAGSAERRAGFLALADETMAELEACKARLAVIRADVRDAEITPRNEETLGRVGALAGDVDGVRQRLWDRVAASGLLPPAVIAEERGRDLPR